MKKISFILIPGLNDGRWLFKFFYRYVKKHWRKRGLHTLLVPMNWEGEETLAEKTMRVEEALKQEYNKGRGVVLVGISAGVSLAVALYERQPKEVLGVVSVVGFFKRERIAEEFINDAWYQSGEASEKALERLTDKQKRKILAFYPEEDKVIEPKRAKLAGAKNVLVPVSGHLRSIVFILLKKALYIRAFSEQLSSYHRTK